MGTSLNNLDLLEVALPSPKGSPYDVLGLLIHCFHISQEDFPITGGEDAVEGVLPPCE